MNKDEIIRENILTYLYEMHQQTKSIKKIALGIRDIQSGLKKRFEYSQKQVTPNLDYLIQIGWVIDETTVKEFTTKAGVKIPQETTKYKISAQGIDYVQGPSKFEKISFANIKIKNIKGIVQVGNHNIVNAEFKDLDAELKLLQRKISNSSLDDEDKLNTEADIASIRTQLSNPTPDKSVVKALWNSAEKSVTAAGFVELCQEVAVLLGPFL